jgi:hypothetical protein
MNSNAFRLNYPAITINELSLAPGQSKEIKVELNN